jgi:hypothetical protein
MLDQSAGQILEQLLHELMPAGYWMPCVCRSFRTVPLG